MPLPFMTPLRSWIATRRQGHADRLRRLDALSERRAGPPVIAIAREKYRRDADIAIGPLETEFRPHPDGFEVRGWLLVRRSELEPEMAARIASTLASLEHVPLMKRRIFFLSASYGAKAAEIAALVGMRTFRVRRAIADVIACLDQGNR